MDRVVKKWYGSERKAGNSTYQHPEVRHRDMIKQSPFKLEEHIIPAYTHNWTIDTLLGNLYSTSYGARQFLGDHIAGFEADFKEQLLPHHPNNLFPETIKLSVLLAIK